MSPTPPTELDVYLRGQRTYVQGSQILGRTADWLRQLGRTDLALASAKFTKITQNRVFAALGHEPPAHIQNMRTALVPLGLARYTGLPGQDASLTDVTFFEVPEMPAPRIADEPSRLAALTDHANLNGESSFRCGGRHDDYLAAVIETVRALHGSLGRKVTDVWFTALSSAALPLEPVAPYTGQLKISPIMARNHEGRRQTFSRVETACDGGGPQIAPFNIAFSCLVDPA